MMIRFPQYKIDETGMAIPFEGINKNALDIRAIAQAQFYSPLNPYMNDKQKNICDIYDNLPTTAFVLSFILFSSFPIVEVKPVLIAIYFSLFFGWLVTTLNKEILSTLIPINYFFFTNPLPVSGLVFLVLFSGNITWISALGLLAIEWSGIFVPGHSISYNVARAKYPRMHPRYGSAKDLFKIEFPFEKYLPQDQSLINQDIYELTGNQILAWIQLFILVFTTVILGK